MVSNNCRSLPKLHLVCIPFQHLLGANQEYVLEGFIGTIAVRGRKRIPKICRWYRPHCRIQRNTYTSYWLTNTCRPYIWHVNVLKRAGTRSYHHKRENTAPEIRVGQNATWSIWKIYMQYFYLEVILKWRRFSSPGRRFSAMSKWRSLRRPTNDGGLTCMYVYIVEAIKTRYNIYIVLYS